MAFPPPSAASGPAVAAPWPSAPAAVAVALLAGTVAGVIIAAAPFAAFALAGLMVAAIVIAAAPRLRSPYLTGFAVLLGGYACIGRAFSYLGYPPIFIGELFLVFGVLIALGCGAWSRFAGFPLAWAIAAFGVWGAIRTVPFVGLYGVDALRDGVIWGYAAFTAIVAACLRPADVERTMRGYGRVVLALPQFVMCLLALSLALGDSAPTLPWAPEVSIGVFKAGDAGVHLGGAAAYVLLYLGPAGYSRAAIFVWWVCWLGAAGLVLAASRGGFLSIAVAVAIATVACGAPARRTLARLTAALAVVTALALLYPEPPGGVPQTSSGRQLSARQLLANITSIVGTVGYGSSGEGFVNLDETKSWRLDWWSDIAKYTVGGEYFLTGKGFGINLADDDGYQVMPELPLRSPHNIHMTVLARSGVPGLLLWVWLNAALVAALFRERRRALAVGHVGRANVCAWIAAYWAALVMNGTFDVYLEGPSGGIWFWALIGFGLAVLSSRRGSRDGDGVR